MKIVSALTMLALLASTAGAAPLSAGYKLGNSKIRTFYRDSGNDCAPTSLDNFRLNGLDFCDQRSPSSRNQCYDGVNDGYDDIRANCGSTIDCQDFGNDVSQSVADDYCGIFAVQYARADRVPSNAYEQCKEIATSFCIGNVAVKIQAYIDQGNCGSITKPPSFGSEVTRINKMCKDAADTF